MMKHMLHYIYNMKEDTRYNFPNKFYKLIHLIHNLFNMMVNIIHYFHEVNLQYILYIQQQKYMFYNFLNKLNIHQNHLYNVFQDINYNNVQFLPLYQNLLLLLNKQLNILYLAMKAQLNLLQYMQIYMYQYAQKYHKYNLIHQNIFHFLIHFLLLYKQYMMSNYQTKYKLNNQNHKHIFSHQDVVINPKDKMKNNNYQKITGSRHYIRYTMTIIHQYISII